MTEVEQWVENEPTNKGGNGAEQRVTNPLANNLLAPQVLQTTSRTHQQCTQRNTPGALPKILWEIRGLPKIVGAHLIPPLDDPAIAIKPTQQRVREKSDAIINTDHATTFNPTPPTY